MRARRLAGSAVAAVLCAAIGVVAGVTLAHTWENRQVNVDIARVEVSPDDQTLLVRYPDINAEVHMTQTPQAVRLRAYRSGGLLGDLCSMCGLSSTTVRLAAPLGNRRLIVSGWHTSVPSRLDAHVLHLAYVPFGLAYMGASESLNDDGFPTYQQRFASAVVGSVSISEGELTVSSSGATAVRGRPATFRGSTLTWPENGETFTIIIKPLDSSADPDLIRTELISIADDLT